MFKLPLIVCLFDGV